MTRNYHRLWQRPHRPHRDSPYPDVPDVPNVTDVPDAPDVPDVPDVPEEHVHLYTYQSDFYPEEFEYFETPSTLWPVWVSNPMFDHGEYESCDEYDHQYRVTSADVDGPYDERELSAEESEPEPSDLNDSFDHGNNHDFDPREPYYANSENSDHFDPREPSHNDYNDQSDGDYYDDENVHAQEFYNEEDILIHDFNKLDLEPSQDLEDYPNYGHGVVYPHDHVHRANKPTFFHDDSNQEYHHDCHICADYMEDFYERGYHDSYSDNE